MKSLVRVALCCLPAGAQPQVYEGKYKGYRYPQLKGLSSPDLQNRVNKQLRGVYSGHPSWDDPVPLESWREALHPQRPGLQ